MTAESDAVWSVRQSVLDLNRPFFLHPDALAGLDRLEEFGSEQVDGYDTLALPVVRHDQPAGGYRVNVIGEEHCLRRNPLFGDRQEHTRRAARSYGLRQAQDLVLKINSEEILVVVVFAHG